MFAEACNEFVRQEGKNSLHATPSPCEEKHVKLYQVVLKSKPPCFFPWMETDFRPSEFELKDMLNDGKDLKKVEPELTKLQPFKHLQSELSLFGWIKATFSKIISVKLIGRSEARMTIEFGTPMMEELNTQQLINELKNRLIDMDHYLVRPIRGDKRNSLCLITGVAFLPDGGKIHRCTFSDLTAEVEADVSITGKPASKVNASAGGKHEMDGDIPLNKDTKVAFKVHELDIEIDTGAIQLALTGGWSKGGSRAGTEDVESQADSARHYLRDALATLIIRENREEVNGNLLKLMEDRDDLGHIAFMLHRVDKAGGDVDISVSKLAQKVKSPREVWQYVLELAGLSVKDDMFITTKYKAPRAQMVAEILHSAILLWDYHYDLLRLATSLSPSNAEYIIKVLEYSFKKQPVTGIVDMVRSDDTSYKILEKLDYIRTSMDQRYYIPAHRHSDIISLYMLLFALYGK